MLNLSVSVFTQPNLGLRYLDNHLLPGIYFYIITPGSLGSGLYSDGP